MWKTLRLRVVKLMSHVRKRAHLRLISHRLLLWLLSHHIHHVVRRGRRLVRVLVKLSVLLTELKPLIIVIVLLVSTVHPSLVVRVKVLIALFYCEKYFTAFISKFEPFHAVAILIVHFSF